MTVRNLKYLFQSRSIAILSAGQISREIDGNLVRNLMNGGFEGPVMPVSPDQRALKGVLTYPDVAALPLDPELALITRPLDQVPALIRQLGERGTKAVVLLAEQRPGTLKPELGQAILEAARPYMLRVLGPDGFGLAAPGLHLNASDSHTPLLPGHIGLVTQSAAVMRSVIDFATARDIGFSKVISVGAKLDVDFGDLLDFLAQDIATRSILLHLEEIRKARKVMSAARVVARIKPVVVLKPRDPDQAQVEDAIYDAAFRRAGILRVNRIEQLFNAAETLATLKPVYNRRLAILCNSRALGLLVRDVLNRAGGLLAELDDATRSELAKVVPPGFPSDNPVDLGDRPEAEAFRRALTLLGKAAGVDGVLVIHAPTSPQRDLDNARAVAEAASQLRRLVLTSWIGGGRAAEQARNIFKEHHIATYNHPGDAAGVFVRMAQYRRNQDLLMETPPSRPTEFEADSDAARRIMERALRAGRDQLNEHETSRVLSAYGIPVVQTRIAEDPHQAAMLARALNRPVALKILSPDIVHKSDVGGVVFGLRGFDEVLEAAGAMLSRVQALAPQAVLEGFMIQPMMSRGMAFETTVGVRTGQQFGPVLRFGHGGTEAEVINDLAYALPPLNMHLARDLMSRTRLYQALTRIPGRRADLDALALTLLKVSQMVIDLGELTELDIDPLWVDGEGVLAVDARIHVAPYEGHPTRRLAIRPYPKELEDSFTLPDGRTLAIRPILPEDEPSLQAMVRRVPAEDLRLRFFQPIRELSHDMAARLTQLDYDREMALTVTGPGMPGKADIWGVVRMTADPDLEKAEYAIIVDRQMTGLGLGPMLMRRIIDYARSRGVKEIFGEVLRENEPMLKLNRALGFRVKSTPDDPGVMHVSLTL